MVVRATPTISTLEELPLPINLWCVFLSKLTDDPSRKSLRGSFLLVVKKDEKYKVCVSAICKKQQQGH